MKRYGMLALFAGLTAQRLFAPLGVGESPKLPSVASSPAELTAALTEAKMNADAFIAKANKFVYTIISTTDSTISDVPDLLAVNHDKLQNTLAALTDATNAHSALDAIVKAMTLMKTLGIVQITYLVNFLDDIIGPLATSAAITDVSAKNRIDKSFDELKKTLNEYKKAFPPTIKRGSEADLSFAAVVSDVSTPPAATTSSIKSALGEAGRELATLGVKEGVGALISWIKGRNDVSNEDKEKIIAAIKSNNNLVEKVKEAINAAAILLANEFNKIKNIDQDIPAAMKEAFKALNDPGYFNAAGAVKFDVLIKGATAMVEAKKAVDVAIKAVHAGIIKFTNAILGEEPDDKLDQLKSTEARAKKSVNNVINTFEEALTVFEDVKSKFSKESKEPKKKERRKAVEARRETEEEEEKAAAKPKPHDRYGRLVENPVPGSTYYDSYNNSFVW
jgi:hypothetical protein